MPALVIAGDLDIVTKLEANRAIAQESDLARLQVVDGVNHLGPMERADVYNQAIADFALQVQPSASADMHTAASPSADRECRHRTSPDAPSALQ